jgi:hypothetical protein
MAMAMSSAPRLCVPVPWISRVVKVQKQKVESGKQKVATALDSPFLLAAFCFPNFCCLAVFCAVDHG